ncbi:MAG: anaerobic glycerol-3-phosphate dehydrogenase subunit GlpB [Candidatus Thorarchaeota archaeon]|jgi:glycerol-3-phosphate dehydrogenase subunit B
MDFESDVLVIGGGMAGLVAGTVACENGLDTLVIQKGQAATSYSSGAIDVFGYMPNGTEPFLSPLEGIQGIGTFYPLHPYGILGFSEKESQNETKGIIERVSTSLNWLKEHLKDSIAPLIGSIEENIFPITVIGTTKPTCLLQETMDTSDLVESEDNVLLFVGLKGHPDFNSGSAAKVFSEQQIVQNRPPRKVGNCSVELAPFGKLYNISSIEIARHLDHDGAIENFAAVLKENIERIGATHVALPPILGLRNARRNQKKLEEILSVKTFELLSFPPSVPGLRLQLALEERYKECGGRFLAGHEVTEFMRTSGLINQVVAKGPRREANIKTKAIVLATGKFIGGGIAGDINGIRETVFDLMTVTSDFYNAEELLPRRYTNVLAISSMSHDIFGTGLSVDPFFRPVGPDGTNASENLFCAGSVLAGYNYAAEKSGLGVCLATGYAAGGYATQAARGELN